jgi:hypothetical protein
VSSSLQNTLSNYFFEVESPDDQVYSKQTRSIKQSKKKNKNKSRIPGIERFIPGNGTKNVAALYTPGRCGRNI